MPKNNIQSKYDRLSKLIRKTRVLLEQEIQTVPDDVRSLADPKEQLEKRRSAVANFTKVTKATSRSSNIIVDANLNVIKEVEVGSKETEFALKNVVVNITKLKGELEKYKNLPVETKNQIEEIQKTLRYFATTHSKLRKEYDNLKEKKDLFDQKMEAIEREKEEKENKLRQELGIQEVEKVETSIKDIEKNTGDQIREIRKICGELYDIPKDIIEATKLYITAMGATGVLSPLPDKIKMSKKGIMKILDDPELFEKLGEFISITEQSDRFQSINVELPKLSNYVADLKMKSDLFIKDVKKTEVQLGEGKIGDISSQIIQNVKEGFREAMQFFVALGKGLVSHWSVFVKSLTSAIESDRKGIDQLKQDGRKFLLKVQRISTEDRSEQLKKAEQEL